MYVLSVAKKGPSVGGQPDLLLFTRQRTRSGCGCRDAANESLGGEGVCVVEPPCSRATVCSADLRWRNAPWGWGGGAGKGGLAGVGEGYKRMGEAAALVAGLDVYAACLITL